MAQITREQRKNGTGRIVCQFSCGAASAVAGKLAIEEHGTVEIINAFLKEEHEDNQRFLKDCEKWLGQKITVLKDKKYGASAYEVFRKERFITSLGRAACSLRLKRKLLDEWKQPGDIMVLGFTADEKHRADSFSERNPDKPAIYPLIENGLTKADCLAIIERAGIAIPQMYLDGFHNNNCIGCPKGGKGYWNHIRKLYPERFKEMSDIEQSIGKKAFLFFDKKTGERTSLADLGENEGRHDDEPDITCSFFCQMAESRWRD